MSEINKLLGGVSSTDTRVKYKSLKALKIISEKTPQKLYSEIDFFIKLLKHENNIFKWNAMDIISNLASIDSKNKISKIFKEFYRFLDSGDFVTAAHVVDNSWKIATAKPKLCSKITNELFRVMKVQLPTKECRNILMGKAIASFSQYIDKVEAEDKKKIIDFVQKHKNNSRNATKVKAEKFLKKNL